MWQGEAIVNRVFYLAIPPVATLEAASTVKRALMGGKVPPLCLGTV